MRTVLIVFSAMALTAPTSPLAGLLWGTTTSNAVLFAAAAQQTSAVSDLEDVAGRCDGDNESGSGSASAGRDDADHEAATMTPDITDITTPSDTSTVMTDNDATTASTASTTSASSQSSVQESGTVGLFRQLQEKFQQIMTPQDQQTQTDSNQKQIMANAQKLQEEQLRKQQQRWSRGVTNPSIHVGPNMPRKSRRRVLYEVSVRSHYADRAESGNNDNGEITSNSSDEGPRPRIDTRKTVAAIILGGRGEVVWEAGVDSARTSSDDSDGKRGVTTSRPMPARKMEGCAYFSTVPSGKKNTKQKMLPYWNYRICPGRSVEQFHVNLRRDMTFEELSEIILEGRREIISNKTARPPAERKKRYHPPTKIPTMQPSNIFHSANIFHRLYHRLQAFSLTNIICMRSFGRTMRLRRKEAIVRGLKRAEGASLKCLYRVMNAPMIWARYHTTPVERSAGRRRILRNESQDWLLWKVVVRNQISCHRPFFTMRGAICG